MASIASKVTLHPQTVNASKISKLTLAAPKQNLYELLGEDLDRTESSNSNSVAYHRCVPGNDPDLDPDREPEPPVQAVDKPIPRTGKRATGGDRPRDGPRGAPRGGGHDVAGHDQSTLRFFIDMTNNCNANVNSHSFPRSRTVVRESEPSARRRRSPS